MSTLKKEKRLCCVKGCSTPQDFVRETLFIFPENSTRRSKRWLELYPNSFVLKPNAENYICGRHFTAECFNKNGALLHKSNPSVNIDTSYAQDILMKSFIMKIIYEWVLRNCIKDYLLVIWDRVEEAKTLLGMQIYTQQSIWVSRFRNFKYAIQKHGARFGQGQNGPKDILGIVKDIRHELPSNFLLPADKIVQANSSAEESVVKIEPEEDTVIEVKLENSDPADEPILEQNLDVVPNKSLDTYQEALELLEPLRDYVKRVNNENASVRLKEIENVLKQVIRNDSQPKRSLRKRRK